MKNQKMRVATTNREYNVVMKGYKPYCRICSKRAGRYDAYCGPISLKKLKNWKQFRRTQYKQ